MNDITTTHSETLLAVAPAKIRTLVEPAHQRGLTIDLDDQTYVVSSPNPIDDHQVWLHYTAGRNGGKIVATLYRPNYRRSVTTKITLVQVRSWLTEMADGLDRHHARQAEKAFNARRDAHAADLSAAAEAPLAVAGDDAGLVVALSARLNRAGRVALRLVRDRGPATGKLSPATHSKIKGAFRRMGLVDTSNTLTDLGRAVRAVL